MTAPTRFAVLGTAGHIDHGKTALVRLLTGVDTDRLKEEKARGISIDLGFAHLDLPSGLSCGIVDVPGHERFVKNMLAGACGIDAVLFVVAADEGVMPQTREHLDILDLLGVTAGVIALTKIDRVEPDWLDLVRETVAEHFAARGYGGFPIVPVSSRTGEGREALLAALDEGMAAFQVRPAGRAARLPVDRAFVVEGFGTVVTGTLWRGSIRVGDQLVVQPGGHSVRVRNVQVHGRDAELARAGQRTAVSLAGLDRDEVPRGTWLVAANSLSPAHMLDVRLRVLADAPRPLRHRQRVRFHLGASEILARVALLEGDELLPGRSALAQLRLEAEAVADRGDRFVLRTYSPARTLAGGTVILPVAHKRRRHDPRAVLSLQREESGSAEDRLAALLEATPGGVTRAELVRVSGLGAADVEPALARLLAEGRALALGRDRVVAEKAVAALLVEAERAMAGYQKAHPLRWGMSRGELRSRLGKTLPGDLFDAVVRRLTGEGRAWERGDAVRTESETLTLPPDMAAKVDRVEDALRDGGVAPPTLRELEATLGGPVADALDYLTFEGRVEKVTPDLFVERAALVRIQEWVRRRLEEDEPIAVSDLRDFMGMSRKYSVPIMEYFDRIGWTRRSGDVRVAGRSFPPSEPEEGV